MAGIKNIKRSGATLFEAVCYLSGESSSDVYREPKMFKSVYLTGREKIRGMFGDEFKNISLPRI